MTLEEVRDELKRLPLDLVLGVVGRLSAWFVNPDLDALHPRLQGEWIRYAIVDDFPAELRGAGAMIEPNRVPHTGGRHLFIHEHNLAALTQLSLLQSPTGTATERLTPQHYMRICRLLLILNDHLSRPTKKLDPSSLRDRRHLGAQLLYHGQFDQFDGDVRKPILNLARWQLLLEKQLPNHLPSAADFFREKSGMELPIYFQAATFLVSQAIEAARGVDGERSPWGLFTSMALGCALHREEISALVGQLTQSGQDFRVAYADASPDDAVFDFRFLQTMPLVEGRPVKWSPLYRLF